jgi:membrane-bound lytic murein transglycosylase MltF
MMMSGSRFGSPKVNVTRSSPNCGLTVTDEGTSSNNNLELKAYPFRNWEFAPYKRNEQISEADFHKLRKETPMSSPRTRTICSLTALGILLISLTGCSSKPQTTRNSEPSATTAPKPEESLQSDVDGVDPDYTLALPKTFGRWTGDWDELSKPEHNVLRLLVLYNKTQFFYDKGRPKGMIPDIAQDLELYLNKQLQRTGPKKFKVAFIPASPGQIEKDLNEGYGDVVASPIIVTPEREQTLDFTIPTISGTAVQLVVVSGKNAPQITSLDDLSGKEIYVTPAYVTIKQLLQARSQNFKQAGKPEIIVKDADKHLTDEDLLEMTNAGVIPATVTLNFRAQLWKQVLPDIIVHSDIPLTDDKSSVAWAMRKNSPQLKALLDDFAKTHRQGTVFGNMMARRYWDNTKFIKDASSQEELKKFQAYVQYFQKYAAEYDFDYLMLAAQGYQESLLDQSKKNPSGATGIMQVIPKYAAAPPINIPNVGTAEPNIHAGTKMLAQIANTYFNDPALTQMNKTLFTFAGYNAGPNRIVRLRKRTAAEGLDPNKWFGNVELMVGKDVGQETVQYVNNIYKYYVAYKMAVEQKRNREAAKEAIAAK